jgi:hypothetical protein
MAEVAAGSHPLAGGGRQTPADGRSVRTEPTSEPIDSPRSAGTDNDRVAGTGKLELLEESSEGILMTGQQKSHKREFPTSSAIGLAGRSDGLTLDQRTPQSCEAFLNIELRI